MITKLGEVALNRIASFAHDLRLSARSICFKYASKSPRLNKSVSICWVSPHENLSIFRPIAQSVLSHTTYFGRFSRLHKFAEFRHTPFPLLDDYRPSL